MRALPLAFLLVGCGSTPPPAPKAAPVSDAAGAPAPPNPCVANPCDATTIDPAVNPCAGAAAERGAKEGGGERR